MDLRDKVRVEPLPEARWTKIEEGVFAALDRDAEDPLRQPTAESPRRSLRAPRRLVFGAAALLLTAAAVIFAIFFAGAHTPLPDAANGPNPSRIVTGASESHLAVGESSIDVAPESAALVTGDDEHGVLVVVDRGSASFEVAPRRGRPPLVVQAGDVRVRVIGTRFTVTRDGDGARVTVERGTVEASAHGKTSLVHAGESWPPKETASAAPDSTEPDATKPAGTGATAAATETRAAHETTRDVVDDARHALAPAPAPPSTSIAPVASVPAAASPPASANANPGGETPAPSPQELFEAASELEGRDPARAVAAYEKLAAAGGPWGMNALFAWARLELERGDHAEARRLLGEYLARYPRGPNAADARVLLQRLP